MAYYALFAFGHCSKSPIMLNNTVCVVYLAVIEILQFGESIKFKLRK